eukprot:3233663-Rhodomonas_salina.2
MPMKITLDSLVEFMDDPNTDEMFSVFFIDDPDPDVSFRVFASKQNKKLEQEFEVTVSEVGVAASQGTGRRKRCERNEVIQESKKKKKRRSRRRGRNASAMVG